MAWELTDDIESFVTAAEAHLHSRPVEHTTLLTLIGTLRRRGLSAYGKEAPVFGTWRNPDGVVAGALLQTPPHPVLFGEVPPPAVTEAVAAFDGRALPGVNLPAAQIDLFVAPWLARTGTTAEAHMRTRLYRLSTLQPPGGPTRPAVPADRALLISWVHDFLAGIGEPVPDVGAVVDEALADDIVTIALDSDGAPAAMVMRTVPAAGVVRIRYVFTPPPLRGRGYAGAATAAACAAARRDGASEVVLFTDLANPTSNGLYQRLGFRPVQDRTVVTFA
ncbi:GNAT family N-acetyltransferase [Actinoplanes sp. NPDC051343]|jgi:GNAT superfamily N-acetyltransferase|uniref:GNAT family N-acetyltransferase n=1 Tax=Actinoplanes sp. NPDC051343 TaxID=3363906 RepID=UPI0037BD2B20